MTLSEYVDSIRDKRIAVIGCGGLGCNVATHLACAGIGRLLLLAISNRDYPVVQAIITIIACIVILNNFIVDVLYKMIDPRISR